MLRTITLFMTMLLALPLTLTACNEYGGGGSENGHKEGTSIRLIAGRSSVETGSSKPVTLTAFVRDADNVLVEGAEVRFAVVSSDASLQVKRGVTDAAGTAEAELTTAKVHANGPVKVRANSRGKSATVTVRTSGTRLVVNGPAQTRRGDDVPLTARLVDGTDGGIADVPVTVNANRGSTVSAGSLRTNSSGKVSFNVDTQSAAPSATEEEVTAKALGVSAIRDITLSDTAFTFKAPDSGEDLVVDNNHTVKVLLEDDSGARTGKTVNFTISRGAFGSSVNTATTNQNGIATVNVRSAYTGRATIRATATAASGKDVTETRRIEFVGDAADHMRLKAGPNTVTPKGDSTLTADVLDANGNPVKGAQVDFTLNGPSGGQLRTATAGSDRDGVAQVVYHAGDRTTGKNAVNVTATIRSAPSIEATTELTVSGEALRVALGTGDDLTEKNSASYKKTWSVLVTDANGNPVGNQTVELSIVPVAFVKGKYEKIDINGDGEFDRYSPNTARECSNEDTNADGVLQPGEDTNGDGVLQPTPAVSVPRTGTTDSDGQLSFPVVYPQSEASWSAMRLTAKVNAINGTEQAEAKEFRLGITVNDLSLDTTPPGGISSPYGTASDCTDPD